MIPILAFWVLGSTCLPFNLRRLNFGFPPSSTNGIMFLHRLFRTKNVVIVRFTHKPGSQNILLWFAKWNDPKAFSRLRFTPPCAFVYSGCVHPDHHAIIGFMPRVDLSRLHSEHFARSHARQPLYLHHITEGREKMRQRPIDHLVWNILPLGIFTGFGLALFQGRNEFRAYLKLVWSDFAEIVILRCSET